MTPAPIRTTRTAVLVWGSGLAVYVLAIAARTAFGVAGPQAIDRFDLSASVLSLFVVIQLGVYALAQVPIGVLLDRIGSRWILTAGAALLSIGQGMLAVADDLPLALAARVLVGLGDAATFVSVLRLIPSWFAPRKAPLLTQLATIIGALGQVVSAVPFMAVLVEFGWEPAFAALGGLGVLVTILAAAVVRDRPAQRIGPDGHAPPRRGSSQAPAAGASRNRQRPMPLGAVLRAPGTWRVIQNSTSAVDLDR
ncbi:MAG: MFS transporter [Georgenia sp.]